LILVDGHVHLYPSFDVEECLSCALLNFRNAFRFSSQKNPTIQVLLLTETEREIGFNHLHERAEPPATRAGSPDASGWALFRTREDASLIARWGQGDQIFLVAGQQVSTAEGLEVLSIGTREKIMPRLSVGDTIFSVREAGAIPVLPWGAGKWLGQRGAAVTRLLMTAGKEPRLFLGDIGGRPRLWPRPPQFTLAGEKGIPILSGSDPLPNPKECSRVGSFGFSLAGSLSDGLPARDLKALLLQDEPSVVSFGSLQNPFDFLRKQAHVRLFAGR
jgi:hypothetical protein